MRLSILVVLFLGRSRPSTFSLSKSSLCCCSLPLGSSGAKLLLAWPPVAPCPTWTLHGSHGRERRQGTATVVHFMSPHIPLGRTGLGHSQVQGGWEVWPLSWVHVGQLNSGGCDCERM